MVAPRRMGCTLRGWGVRMGRAGGGSTAALGAAPPKSAVSVMVGCAEPCPPAQDEEVQPKLEVALDGGQLEVEDKDAKEQRAKEREDVVGPVVRQGGEGGGQGHCERSANKRGPRPPGASISNSRCKAKQQPHGDKAGPPA